MDEYEFIEIKWGKQYGDCFLYWSTCPFCGFYEMRPFPFMFCQKCCADLNEYHAILSKDFKFKTVVGTKRKRITKRTIQNLLKYQDNLCAYCDQELDDYECEHIIPLACGGTNNFDNLVISCRRCNHIAGPRWFKNFIDKRLYILRQIRKKDKTFYDAIHRAED